MLNNSLQKSEKNSLTYKINYFEQHKYENFVQSSLLENIEITPVNSNLDEIIKKYQLMAETSDVR